MLRWTGPGPAKLVVVRDQPHSPGSAAAIDTLPYPGYSWMSEKIESEGFRTEGLGPAAPGDEPRGGRHLEADSILAEHAAHFTR